MAEKSTGKLLTAAQQMTCQTIAAQKIEIESQRATALLAINDGEPQAKAAELSGLSVGQVRYLITNFKKKGLDLFPQELVTQEKPVQETTEPPKTKAKGKETKAEEKPETEETASSETQPTKSGKKRPIDKKKKKSKKKHEKQGRKAAKSKKAVKKKKKKKRSKKSKK